MKQDFGLEERPPPKKSRAEMARERMLQKEADEKEKRDLGERDGLGVAEGAEGVVEKQDLVERNPSGVGEAVGV